MELAVIAVWCETPSVLDEALEVALHEVVVVAGYEGCGAEPLDVLETEDGVAAGTSGVDPVFAVDGDGEVGG